MERQAVHTRPSGINEACIPTAGAAVGFWATLGTQAGYVRLSQADGSLYYLPVGGDKEATGMLNDIPPIGDE